MTNYKESGALITGNPHLAAEALARGKVVSTTFGPRIYAIHTKRGNEPNMARDKGRERGKPFVVTTDRLYVETALIENPDQVGIDSTTSPQVLEWFKQLLTSSEHPIGVLLPTTNDGLSEYQVGNGNVSVNDVPQRTAGFMTPGSDANYLEFIKYVPEQFVSSTSVNRGGDQDAGGSGHHRLYGLVQDFGQNSNVCIAVPSDWTEKSRVGVSTTTFFLNKDGVRLVRVGSLNNQQAIRYCRDLNIPYLGEIDGGARQIRAFDYSRREPEAVMAAAYQHFKEQTIEASFLWTPEAQYKCQQAIAQALLAVDYTSI